MDKTIFKTFSGLCKARLVSKWNFAILEFSFIVPETYQKLELKKSVIICLKKIPAWCDIKAPVLIVFEYFQWREIWTLFFFFYKNWKNWKIMDFALNIPFYYGIRQSKMIAKHAIIWSSQLYKSWITLPVCEPQNFMFFTN